MPYHILAFTEVNFLDVCHERRWSGEIETVSSCSCCPIHGNEQILRDGNVVVVCCCPKTFPVVSKEEGIFFPPFVSQQKFSLYKVSDEKIGRKDAQHEVSSSITCMYHHMPFRVRYINRKRRYNSKKHGRMYCEKCRCYWIGSVTI